MENLLPLVEKHLINQFSQLPASFLYHNINHTKNVLKYLNELIEGEGINENDALALQVAVWFHDIGYIDGIEGHEEASAKKAKAFLQSLDVDEAFITQVEKLILATNIEHKPTSHLEEIIKDADCAHVAAGNANSLASFLREEKRLLYNHIYTDIEWVETNIDFYSNYHKFYTHYAQANWQEDKNSNLAALYKRLKKLKKEAKKQHKKEQEFAIKKNKAILPERGIETMFRVTLRNHIDLSDIADTKANILLSVNAIIVSLLLANLIPKLDNPSNQHLLIPTIIFILFTIASMVLSVLATRPNVTEGKFTKEDVENKKVNILFFGNFHKMRLDEFEWAMGEVMKDKDYLYGSLIKDLYFLGKVLDKKYKLLRLTYLIFVLGIVTSVIAFAVSFKMQGQA